MATQQPALISLSSADAEDCVLFVLVSGHGDLTSQRFQGGTPPKQTSLSSIYIFFKKIVMGKRAPRKVE